MKLKTLTKIVASSLLSIGLANASTNMIITSDDLAQIEDGISKIATGMTATVQLDHSTAECRANDLSQSPGFECTVNFGSGFVQISNQDIDLIKDTTNMLETGQSATLILQAGKIQCRNNSLAEQHGFRCTFL